MSRTRRGSTGRERYGRSWYTQVVLLVVVWVITRMMRWGQYWSVICWSWTFKLREWELSLSVGLEHWLLAAIFRACCKQVCLNIVLSWSRISECMHTTWLTPWATLEGCLSCYESILSSDTIRDCVRVWGWSVMVIFVVFRYYRFVKITVSWTRKKHNWSKINS